MPKMTERVAKAVYRHLIANWGEPSPWMGNLDYGSREIGLLEFPPNPSIDCWIYATIGMCVVEQVFPSGNNADFGTELVIYSKSQRRDLAGLMGALAAYPEEHKTVLEWGQTIPGSGEGVLPDSPLTELMLLRPYLEAESFEALRLPNGSHVHMIWVVPLYLAEREYVRSQSRYGLIEIFERHEVDASDLHRVQVPLPQ